MHGALFIDALLLAVGVWAGMQNALAGGGSFITLPALILAGLDPRAANITSTIALFPSQVLTGHAGRGLVAGLPRLPFRVLFALSLLGGALGGVLLLATSPAVFALLVPWLVLLATSVFAWGSFRPKRAVPVNPDVQDHPWKAGAAQFAIAIYGGYFGGGIGFLMLAVLTMAAMPVRNAVATKNALASVMNASAVLIFVFSNEAHWREGAFIAAGAMAGGLFGTWLLGRLNEKLLRFIVVIIGVVLTIALFARR